MTNALALVSVEDVLKTCDDLSSGDVSGAWVAWSTAAESALVDAFCLAGGPVPERGFCLGRGFVWVDRRCVRLRPGVLILVMEHSLISFEIAVLLRWLT